ncbi:hypothetical protein [Rodentibacter pneumotropicus]|uniref:Restriction endonuclease n=1 Tax=Rodentibacter pneumotropicus TaxID=758 RepID=A0A4S2Q4B7_9PAST|nr:hypothetical protein [Rodentibacter pneumotropicus]THA11452.1 hypothetical protein D3M78_00180 [Rodentibacter pneumotropicus]
MSSNIRKPNKGARAEELLRFYFLKAGYYAVRSIPYKYEAFDITDVDLFLYSRVSALSREKTIVDIKNKKTPQALERIFWVKGLQAALKMDRSVVATTDTRPAIANYGKEQNVIIIDGNLLKRLEKLSTEYQYRLTDDEFLDLIDKYPFQKLDGGWKNRVMNSKSLLILGMSFDHINFWIDNANFFANQVLYNSNYKQYALRCLYLICSFILIGIDFQMKEISSMEHPARIDFLNEGFTYGAKGKSGTDNIIKNVLTLIKNTSHGSALANQLQESLDRGFEQLNSNILSEYFSKTEISKLLFDLARELEGLAMNKEFIHHSDHPNSAVKGTLFCLLDYWQISRTRFESLSI